MKNPVRLPNVIKLPAILLILALVLTACNLPGSNAAATQVPTLAFPTALPSSAPVIASSTPASIPATSVPAATATNNPPTAVPPQPTDIPNATRIKFATGATAAVAQGQVEPNQVANFLVAASKDQPLMVSVTSPNNDLTLMVIGQQDGHILLAGAQKLSSWQTILTLTQDYLIVVIGGSATETFTLNVIAPARVTFDPGAVSTVLKGSTPGGWNVSYILRARADQKLDLKLDAPAGNGVLSMYGFQDGNPYLRYVVEQTSFSMTLPTTQDYIVQVVPRAGMVIDYTLTITIK